MEAAFNQLQKDGKNDVDNLVKLMKDSKITDGSQEQEAKVRGFFDDAENKNNISLDKFKEVLGKIANEFHVSLEEITKKFTSFAPQLRDAVSGAASSVKQAAQDLLPKLGGK